jgi:hypothetical protein
LWYKTIPEVHIRQRDAPSGAVSLWLLLELTSSRDDLSLRTH